MFSGGTVGEKNNVICSYLGKERIFADFINGSLFAGKNVIRPEELENSQDTGNEQLNDRTGKKYKSSRSRDVVKKWLKGKTVAIIATENQEELNHIMPFRCMEYDVIDYRKQIRQLQEKHKRDGDLKGDADFLSGVKSTDKWIPVATIVFYHGSKPWETCKELYDMLNFDCGNEIMKEYVSNYRMNLISVESLDESWFQTGLREMIGMMKRRNDMDEMKRYCEENAERFQQLDADTYDAICTMVDQKKLLDYKEACRNKDGGMNMCKAFDDWEKKARQEGMELGETRGHQRGQREGIELGIKGMSELILRLIAENRISDVEIAAKDEAYRRTLFRKYGIAGT